MPVREYVRASLGRCASSHAHFGEDFARRSYAEWLPSKQFAPKRVPVIARLA